MKRRGSPWQSLIIAFVVATAGCSLEVGGRSSIDIPIVNLGTDDRIVLVDPGHDAPTTWLLVEGMSRAILTDVPVEAIDLTFTVFDVRCRHVGETAYPTTSDGGHAVRIDGAEVVLGPDVSPLASAPTEVAPCGR